MQCASGASKQSNFPDRRCVHQYRWTGLGPTLAIWQYGHAAAWPSGIGVAVISFIRPLPCGRGSVSALRTEPRRSGSGLVTILPDDCCPVLLQDAGLLEVPGLHHCQRRRIHMPAECRQKPARRSVPSPWLPSLRPTSWCVPNVRARPALPPAVVLCPADLLGFEPRLFRSSDLFRLEALSHGPRQFVAEAGVHLRRVGRIADPVAVRVALSSFAGAPNPLPML